LYRAASTQFLREGRISTMLKLNQRQRTLLADKLFDFGNLAAGALVFGQFIGEHAVSLKLVGAGLLAWIVFLGVSVAVARGTRP
jgi:hypothetical protein